MAAVCGSDGLRAIKDERGNESVDAYFGIGPKTKKPAVGEKVKSIFQSNRSLAVEQIQRRMGEEVEIAFGNEEIGSQRLAPEEIAARLFRHLKRSAEAQLEEEVDCCVITVPANFPGPARRATQRAGEIAGMTVERLINEPTAAVLACSHHEEIEEEYVMVYHFGRGTFNVSIVKQTGDVPEVRASSGDSRIGVNDLDEALLWHVAETFDQEHDISVEPESGNYARLLSECENVRNELVHSRETSAHIPFFVVKNEDPVDLQVEIHLSEYEDIIGPVVAGTVRSVENVLSAASLTRSDLGEIILTGEGARVPYVRSFVRHATGYRPLKSVDPEKAIAFGAARQAAIIDGKAAHQTPVTPDQNHYEVPGVSEDASVSEIEKAFFQKVRDHPPEQDPATHKRIRKAYDVLTKKIREKADPAWRKSDYFDDVEALLQVASDELNSDMEAEKEERLRSLMEEFKRALAENDGERVKTLEEKITDVLFDTL